MRRFRRFPRKFSKPVMRERPTWLTSVFSSSAVLRTGVINRFNVCDPSVFGIAAAGRVHIRRLLLRGGVGVIPEFTTFANGTVNMHAALYVINREDTDATLLTTSPGDILEGGVERLLWTDVQICTIREQPSASGIESYIPAIFRVDIDLKTRVNLGYDDVVELAFQFGSDVTGVVSDARYSGIHRALHVTLQG